jgi:hypothetical protein
LALFREGSELSDFVAFGVGGSLDPGQQVRASAIGEAFRYTGTWLQGAAHDAPEDRKSSSAMEKRPCIWFMRASAVRPRALSRPFSRIDSYRRRLRFGFVLECHFCDFLVKVDHLRAEVPPFRVPLYQRPVLLGIEGNLDHELDIHVTERFPIFDPVLELEQSRQSLLFEPLDQGLNNRKFIA